MWPPASKLGLGLAALGRPGYMNLGHAEALGRDYRVGSMERHCLEVLEAAYQLGVRYFDAARSYGRAEEFLSHWPRRDITIASKWGYTYTADWRVDAEKHEVKELSLANLEKQLAESKALLPLDLYQIHSATLEVLEDHSVIERMRRLKDEGIHVGLSLTGPRQKDTLEKALTLKLFDAVQATFNLLETSVGEMLARAKDEGLLVVVKEGMANGRILEDARVKLLASEMQVGSDALALAFILQQPFVDVVLSGAATVEQVRQNAAALSIEAPRVDFAEAPEAYWSTRSQLSWN
jgi:aryl-alcohol dehydrogenase-like predicted oxidoreductase